MNGRASGGGERLPRGAAKGKRASAATSPITARKREKKKKEERKKIPRASDRVSTRRVWSNLWVVRARRKRRRRGGRWIAIDARGSSSPTEREPDASCAFRGAHLRAPTTSSTARGGNSCAQGRRRAGCCHHLSTLRMTMRLHVFQGDAKGGRGRRRGGCFEEETEGRPRRPATAFVARSVRWKWTRTLVVRQAAHPSQRQARTRDA